MPTFHNGDCSAEALRVPCGLWQNMEIKIISYN